MRPSPSARTVAGEPATEARNAPRGYCFGGRDDADPGQRADHHVRGDLAAAVVDRAERGGEAGRLAAQPQLLLGRGQVAPVADADRVGRGGRVAGQHARPQRCRQRGRVRPAEGVLDRRLVQRVLHGAAAVHVAERADRGRHRDEPDRAGARVVGAGGERGVGERLGRRLLLQAAAGDVGVGVAGEHPPVPLGRDHVGLQHDLVRQRGTHRVGRPGPVAVADERDRAVVGRPRRSGTARWTAACRRSWRRCRPLLDRAGRRQRHHLVPVGERAGQREPDRPGVRGGDALQAAAVRVRPVVRGGLVVEQLHGPARAAGDEVGGEQPLDAVLDVRAGQRVAVLPAQAGRAACRSRSGRRRRSGRARWRGRGRPGRRPGPAPARTRPAGGCRGA